MEGFKCQALAFGVGKGALQETRFAFEDSTQSFGPESFSTLQRAVKDDVAQPSLALVMQLLRLSRLDPDVFMKFRAPLVDQVRCGCVSCFIHSFLDKFIMVSWRSIFVWVVFSYST